MSAWQTMSAAIAEARQLMRDADTFADQMAQMLCDRLRKVDASYLIRLKRELQKFDATTKRWKP